VTGARAAVEGPDRAVGWSAEEKTHLPAMGGGVSVQMNTNINRVLRLWAVFAGSALGLTGCPVSLGQRCGDGLPPCSSGDVCVVDLCVSGGVDAAIDGGLEAVDAGCPVCRDWEVCQANACVTVSLAFVSPVDGGVYDGGTPVSVLVEARAAGRVIGKAVPLTGTLPGCLRVSTRVNRSASRSRSPGRSRFARVGKTRESLR